MKEHPFTRYAEALIRVENELSVYETILSSHLANEIEKGLDTFRMKPTSNFEGKEKISYSYFCEAKGDPNSGVFLSPNIISQDKQAKNIWNESNEIKKDLVNSELSKTDSVKMSIAPMSGEFLNFSLTNSIGRGKPKATLLQIALNTINTLTSLKPCLQYRIEKKDAPETFNTCLIPDLPLAELMDFVILFKKLQKSKSHSDLMVGEVVKKTEGKVNHIKESFLPKRPLIYRGNFPNPPRSSALGSIALLGAIGEFAKEADVSTLANKVLDSLKDATMYMFKYGGASTFTYNHHVVDLAKAGKLRELVDGVYYTELYNEGRRSSKSTEYQKFDLFSCRFLQIFNKPAFKDFIAFRAEYPIILKTIFNTYFQKIEMINPEIVSSARILGRWLNQVAYFAAKNEIKIGSPNYWEELRKVKAKVLVELESSTFSSKSGDALIAQAVTRAGRISGMDAPEGAALYMEKTASGELNIESAKNLLIAFSRLKNKTELKETLKEDTVEDESGDSSEETVDLSNE